MATRPVFSSLFFSAAACPSGLTVVGGPDNAHVWVVRDIVLNHVAAWYTEPSSISVTDAGGAYIFSVLPPDSVSGRLYHWQGRQVLPWPNTLDVHATTTGWSVRISGYNLTLT